MAHSFINVPQATKFIPRQELKLLNKLKKSLLLLGSHHGLKRSSEMVAASFTDKERFSVSQAEELPSSASNRSAGLPSDFL